MKPKIKIVHLIQSLDNGGCENMLLRLLPRTPFENTIITLSHEGTMATQFRKSGIDVQTVSQHNLFDVKSYQRLCAKLKIANPDLVITYLFHADVVGRLIVRPFYKYRVISYLRTTYNHSLYRIPRLFERFTHRMVTRYFANSESVRQFYVKNLGVDSRKITVIPNGVDIAQFNLPKNNSIRRELGIKDTTLLIVCVANLHPNKGHSYLLEAFESAFDEGQDVALVLVGDGKERVTLEKQIKDFKTHNRVYFMGKRNDVPVILSETDVFVLPTLFEGMSNALLEAMASKCAIVTTNIPENIQVVEHAHFVPPQNSSELASSLRLLYSNPNKRAELAQLAYKEVKQKYDLDAIAQRFTQVVLQEVT